MGDVTFSAWIKFLIHVLAAVAALLTIYDHLPGAWRECLREVVVTLVT